MPRLALATIALLGGGLALAPAAWAWDVGAESEIPVPGPATVLVAGPWGDGAALALAGPSTSWVIDPATGDVLATVDAGAVALVLGDHDGDGVTDLVLCGPEGLSWAQGHEGGFRPVLGLSSTPCAAVAAYAPEGGRGLVSAGEDVDTWTIGADGVLGGPVRFGTKLAGPPVLVAAGPRFAVAGLGGTEIQEQSEWGRSTYTAPGPIGGLSAGPRNWAWSVPRDSTVEDVTRRRVFVGASPGLLRSGDLDGDGVLEVLVAHPETVGLIVDEDETLLQAPGGARDIAVADLDGDRCGEVAVLWESTVRIHHGSCPTDAIVQAGGAPIELVLDQHDLQVDAWVGKPLRVQLRDPLGQPDTRYSGRGGPDGFSVAEDGLVTWLPESDDVGEWTVSVRMWGGPDLVRVVPVRLLVHLGGTPGSAPGEPNRLVLGDEWPTVQVLVGETAVLRLEDGLGDATSYRWRGGPPGLQIRSDGLARYTALQEHIGQWRVDLRLKGQKSARKTAFFVRVAPRTAVSAPDGSAAAVEAQRMASVGREPGFLQPRGCMISIGIVGGLTGTQNSWQNVGNPVYFSFSPALAATCEGGRPQGVQWFAGADTAPVYAYLLDEDSIGVHTLVGTVGFSLGNQTFRVGPYFSAGILLTGVGARVWWLPFVTRGGLAHGFEFRAAWVFASTASGEAMLMYGWRFGRPK